MTFTVEARASQGLAFRPTRVYHDDGESLVENVLWDMNEEYAPVELVVRGLDEPTARYLAADYRNAFADGFAYVFDDEQGGFGTRIRLRAPKTEAEREIAEAFSPSLAMERMHFGVVDGSELQEALEYVLGKPARSSEGDFLLPGRECQCRVDYRCPNHDSEAEKAYYSGLLEADGEEITKERLVRGA